MKVYLTLNTLLTDRELPAAAKVAEECSGLGVDAVLVQDLGMFGCSARWPQICRSTPPPDERPQSGRREALRGQGMTRVVLSRELSGTKSPICANSPIEIEVFTHGALCMCYSGQCFLSSVIGGRSGNRGLCAQPAA